MGIIFQSLGRTIAAGFVLLIILAGITINFDTFNMTSWSYF
ncbi:MAG: hypothetical protein RI956_627, partial [Pseudomonadota bacterium]